MKCPNDQTTLLITERQNIEIDYCPECRGVWLDRGELDKLIERGSATVQPDAPRPTPPATSTPRRQSEDKQDYYTDDYRRESYRKKHRKESFLGDLFDF